MFADDIELVREMVEKYGPAKQPIVECGGIANPCIADYQRTIDAMRELYERTPQPTNEEIHAAQTCRYLNIERPLSFLGPYELEDPAVKGGLPLERLAEKYHGNDAIGTAILLSVLEHVDDPFEAVDRLRDAMADDGIAIVSVPFMFPLHEQCGQDCWRFTPTGLRHLFSPPKGTELPPCWEILESGWRLRIGADAGVIDLTTGKPQAIESCYLVARAVGQ